MFSQPEHNPCITLLMATALKHASLPPRDPSAAGGLLSLGGPGLVAELFVAAGFEEVATTRIDAPFQLPSVRVMGPSTVLVLSLSVTRDDAAVACGLEDLSSCSACRQTSIFGKHSQKTQSAIRSNVEVTEHRSEHGVDEAERSIGSAVRQLDWS